MSIPSFMLLLSALVSSLISSFKRHYCELLPPGYGCLMCWYQINLPKALFWWCHASLKPPTASHWVGQTAWYLIFLQHFPMNQTNLTQSSTVLSNVHGLHVPKLGGRTEILFRSQGDHVNEGKMINGIQYLVSIQGRKRSDCGLWRIAQHTFHVRGQLLPRPRQWFQTGILFQQSLENAYVL